MSAHERGFSLVETLVTLTVVSLVAGGILVLTGQWFGSWRSAAGRLQSTDRLAALLVQMRQEISSALALPTNENIFLGLEKSVSFIAPHSAGVEHIAWIATSGKLSRAVRADRAAAWRETEVIERLSIGFEFSGDGGDWNMEWRNKGLPRAVRLTLRSLERAGEPFVMVIPMRATLPAVCARATSLSACNAMAAGEPIGLPQAAPARARRRGGSDE